MTETKIFETAAEANAFLDSLGGYVEPKAVTPLKGESAHEVAVGPVHAGVIEPGHFRFQCMGEDVYNLQIFLGYQHRGVEDAIAAADGNRSRQIALAETCAGDTSIAAATCFAEICEARDGKHPTDEDLRLRELLLELERVANHVGDLGALAGDVAFLPTASFCGRIRGEYLNMTALVCGNRFGRNAVVPGGMRVALTDEKKAKLTEWIARTKKDLDGALKLMFEEPTVLERLEGTGVVSKEIAEEIGLVGVARRASVELHGDVLSRAQIRRIEIDEAHARIASLLGDAASCRVTAITAPHPGDAASCRVTAITATRSGDAASCRATPQGDAASRRVTPITATRPGDAASCRVTTIVATVNAWRGPLVHAALFDPDGKLLRYKIVDPSAHNWQGLAYALRGEQISNFPICNKSFNLSYCGTDR